ncbi:hypothetical protein HMPREF3196_00625 [Bifidobacterium bifidum]|uniref:Uncharacterized protein n=1 Tax=Bifidobacterium bifidum TaxID=1681 RepID=A0A133KR89_BIFBI|nr:hypothetical protein HMPREF3196_00625 [Bifidobacterium bifidum]
MQKTSVLDISCHATDTKNPLRITESPFSNDSQFRSHGSKRHVTG